MESGQDNEEREKTGSNEDKIYETIDENQTKNTEEGEKNKGNRPGQRGVRKDGEQRGQGQ